MTVCEGCDSRGNWLGLRLGDDREPLKVPGDGTDRIRDAISEDLSGQLS